MDDAACHGVFDISAVRTRISFALARLGAPLTSIAYLLDHRHDTQPETGADMGGRLAALRGVEIFRSLGEDELRPLASRMKSESFAPGEVILRQGDPGGSAYIVKSGRVRILLSHDAGITEQVACIAPGGFFGEMSLLTGEPRTATALALEQADCYRLAKPELDVIFSAHPNLAEDIAALLAERQTGLAAAREKLGEEAERQRMAQSRNNLLARIRRYFG